MSMPSPEKRHGGVGAAYVNQYAGLQSDTPEGGSILRGGDFIAGRARHELIGLMGQVGFSQNLEVVQRLNGSQLPLFEHSPYASTGSSTRA
jgi:hypothetical protein